MMTLNSRKHIIGRTWERVLISALHRPSEMVTEYTTLQWQPGTDNEAK